METPFLLVATLIYAHYNCILETKEILTDSVADISL